jgi:hypothetical protein
MTGDKATATRMREMLERAERVELRAIERMRGGAGRRPRGTWRLPEPPRETWKLP